MSGVLFPDKKYKIIYADPPWSYRDKARAGGRGADFKYETQSIDWITNLPVSSLADSNCVLFLWVTMPKLNECWEVIKKWGFIYKTVAFTWVKRNKKSEVLYDSLNTLRCLIITSKNYLKMCTKETDDFVELKRMYAKQYEDLALLIERILKRMIDCRLVKEQE